MIARSHTGWALALLAGAFLILWAGVGSLSGGRVVSEKWSSILASRFDRAGYTLEAVRGGAPVPRLFVERLPRDMAEIALSEDRKRLFIRIVLPLVLAENERLEARRALFEAILAKRASGARLSGWEQTALDRALDEFGVDPDHPEQLLLNIDTVPVSLALAQAAEETGWGQSRFSVSGHALFGQWTFDLDQGIETIRRESGLVFAVRGFDDLRASVRAYLFNLNHHRAYRAFRAERSRLRAAGLTVSGLALVQTMTHYSERRGAYVTGIRRLIAANRLVALDTAALTPR